MGNSTNWKGQELHAVDQWLWFKSSDEQRNKLIELYNALEYYLDEDHLNKLNILIDEFRSIAVTEREWEINGVCECGCI